MQVSDLKIGSIVLFFDNASYNPKPKFSVVIGVSDDSFFLGTVFINTNIKVEHLDSPELVKLHYKISQEKYSRFLKHDSYIDCSDIKHRLQTTFIQELNASSATLLGVLAADDLKNVLNIVSSSDTISPYYLKLYNIIIP
jgi:hypothetical protein